MRRWCIPVLTVCSHYVTYYFWPFFNLCGSQLQHAGSSMQHEGSYLIIAAMWDLVSSQGIEPGQPALELWSPIHWMPFPKKKNINAAVHSWRPYPQAGRKSAACRSILDSKLQPTKLRMAFRFPSGGRGQNSKSTMWPIKMIWNSNFSAHKYRLWGEHGHGCVQGSKPRAEQLPKTPAYQLESVIWPLAERVREPLV